MNKLLAALGALAIALTIALPVSATKSEKVYVCHAAGREGTTHYVTLHVPATELGYPQGHFTNKGAPEAGHEEDYLGPCVEPSAEPSSTPSPTSEPTPSAEPSQPTVTPTPEPTVSPSETPTQTPTPTSSPSPEPSPSATPEPTSEPTPTTEPSSSPEPTQEPTPSPSSSVQPTPSTGTPTPLPSSSASTSPTVRHANLPETSTRSDESPYTLPLFLLAGIGTIAYLLIFTFKKPYRRR